MPHKHHHHSAQDASDTPSAAIIYNLPAGCNCASRTTYNGTDIQAACDQALTLASEGKTVGNDKYPHVYNDYEKFNFGNAQKPFFEFPIMSNDEVYTGSDSPGTDRIVIGSVAADYTSAIFCAVITHSGATTHNGFVECKDDTVNPGGEGDWDTERTKDRGLEAPDGRLLLRWEDAKLPFWK